MGEMPEVRAAAANPCKHSAAMVSVRAVLCSRRYSTGIDVNLYVFKSGGPLWRDTFTLEVPVPNIVGLRL